MFTAYTHIGTRVGDTGSDDEYDDEYDDEDDNHDKNTPWYSEYCAKINMCVLLYQKNTFEKQIFYDRDAVHVIPRF